MDSRKILTIAIIFAAATAGYAALAKTYHEKTSYLPREKKMKLAASNEAPQAHAYGISRCFGGAEFAGEEKFIAVNRVPTDKKIIVLTFDADMTYGMEEKLKNGKVKSWYNEETIKYLEKTKTPATLFLTGLWIKNYPEITKNLAENPLFEIANHSYSHPAFASPCYKLPVISDNFDDEEIAQTEKLLERFAPNYKKYFRFPGLCYDGFDVSAVEKRGYKIIGGDVKGLDGFTRDANDIIYRVVSRAKPGSIIILHMHGGPNAPATAEALPKIIEQLKEKGYEFAKVSELIEKH